MAGNSTMANKPYRGSNPEKGWGQVLGLYFNEQVKVENHAVNGQSSKSFIDEGKWDNLLQQVQEGGYVIIEFGHNDEKKENPSRYAAPRSEEHTSELQSLMRISYAVFCLKKKKKNK